MGSRNPFDPVNGCLRDPATGSYAELVDLKIGEAYEVVKFVFEHLTVISAVAGITFEINDLAASLASIDAAYTAAVAGGFTGTKIQWLSGLNGRDGVDGAQGPVGPAGPQGVPGPKGDTGTAGPTGQMGIQGPAGPEGPQGNPGPKGDTGAVGPAGPRGFTGAEGAASTIPGPTGPSGIQGPQGLVGAQGPVGPTGPKGDIGAIGPQGAQGPIGLSGADSTVPGPQGPVGPKGDTGAQGSQGVKGDTGDVGAVGPAGPQGVAGPQGIAGPVGPAGPAGGFVNIAINDFAAAYQMNSLTPGYTYVTDTNKYYFAVSGSIYFDVGASKQVGATSILANGGFTSSSVPPTITPSSGTASLTVDTVNHVLSLVGGTGTVPYSTWSGLPITPGDHYVLLFTLVQNTGLVTPKFSLGDATLINGSTALGDQVIYMTVGSVNTDFNVKYNRSDAGKVVKIGKLRLIPTLVTLKNSATGNTSGSVPENSADRTAVCTLSGVAPGSTFAVDTQPPTANFAVVGGVLQTASQIGLAADQSSYSLTITETLDGRYDSPKVTIFTVLVV